MPGLPSWFEWVNHLFSLFGIWAPVLFVYQRRHIESLLKEVNERLERGVEARTVGWRPTGWRWSAARSNCVC